MDEKPLVVDHQALINDISLWISKNRPELFHRGFAVSHDQRYLGMVSGLALVQAATGSSFCGLHKIHGNQRRVWRYVQVAGFYVIVRIAFNYLAY